MRAKMKTIIQLEKVPGSLAHPSSISGILYIAPTTGISFIFSQFDI